MQVVTSFFNKSLNKLFRFIALLVSAVILSACSGSSGNDDSLTGAGVEVEQDIVLYSGSISQAQISASNATSLIDLVLGGAANSESLVGISTTNTAGKVPRVSTAVFRSSSRVVGNAAITSTSIIAAGVVNQTIKGSISGSATVSGTLADNRTGSIGIAFLNFNDGFGTFDGSIMLEVQSTDPGDKHITKATISFNVVTYKNDVDNLAFSGSLQIKAPSGYQEKYIANITGRDNVSGKMFKTENLEMDFSYAYGFMGYAETISGRVYDSALGFVDVSTPGSLSHNPYTQNDAPFTDRGVVILSGAGGSKLRLQALPQDKIQVQIDSDGDNKYEQELTLPLSKFDAVKATDFCSIKPSSIAKNLLLSYNFDEAAGGYAFDRGDQSMHAQIYGASRVAGKRGSALRFEGQGSFALLPTMLMMGGTQFTANFDQGITVEAWIKPETSSTQVQQLIGNGGSYDGFVLQLNNDKLEFILPDSTGYTGQHSIITGMKSITKDVWTHIALTFDGSTARIYVNGSEDSSQDVLFPIAQIYNSMYVGASRDYSGTVNEYMGTIDELQVFNTMRTSSEIVSDYQQFVSSDSSEVLCSLAEAAAPQPVMIYHLDELSGAKALDSSGGQFDGTVTLAARVDGKKGKALDFSAPQSRVEIPLLSFGMNNAKKLPDFRKGSLTIEAWINPTKLESGLFYQIIGDGNGGTTSMRFQLNDGKIELLAAGTNGDGWHSIIVSQQAPATNVWSHVAVTFDGTTARTFMNGVKDNEKLISFVIQQPINNWSIGSFDLINQFPGAIDEIAIHDEAFSPEQIQIHYQSP